MTSREPGAVTGEEQTAPLAWSGWPERLEHLARCVVNELSAGRADEALAVLNAMRTELDARRHAVAEVVNDHD